MKIRSLSMPMEGWVKSLSPQNTLGVSGLNSVGAKSNTIEINVDRLFKCKKTTKYIDFIYAIFAVCAVFEKVCLRKCVNAAASSWILMSGLGDTWMTPQEQNGGILFLDLVFLCLKNQSPATSILKGFMDSNTSPTPPSAQWWRDNEWIFIFQWTIPLTP